MPDQTGLDVIRDLVASSTEGERPAMIMMTAHGSIESAVEAMKLGARDYLQKPFEVDELLVVARRAIEDQRARLGLRYLLNERDAEFNARHDAFLDSRAGRVQSIVDAILPLLHRLSVAAPTLICATPPASFASRSCSFSCRNRCRSFRSRGESARRGLR